MPDESKNEIYLCVVKHEGEPHPRGFKSGKSVDELEKWALEKSRPDEEESFEADSGIQDTKPNLLTLMNSIAETGNRQKELISLTSAMKNSFPMTLFQSEVVEPMFASAEPVKAGDTFRIGKIEDAKIVSVISSLEKVNKIRDGLDYLPTAIFLSLIATFDTQMSDVVRSMLMIKSDRLKFSARQIPLSKVMSASSISEIIDEQIIEEVYLFSRGSHDEQVQFIEESFSIEIRKSWSRWSEFIEIFERRNLVAHGERLFTKRYVDICKSHELKDAASNLGKAVTLDHAYLTRSLTILSEFAILTIFMLWRKHVPGEKEAAFDAVNEVAFNCINSHRSRLASRVCEFAISLKNSGIKEATRLRLVVNLSSALMHLKEEGNANNVLNKEDWSATSDDFQISVAALRKDVVEVNRLMPMVKASERLSASEFRIWPVFDFIKDDESFREKYKEVYGEALVPVAPDLQATDRAPSAESDQDVEAGKKTMH